MKDDQGRTIEPDDRVRVLIGKTQAGKARFMLGRVQRVHPTSKHPEGVVQLLDFQSGGTHTIRANLCRVFDEITLAEKTFDATRVSHASIMRARRLPAGAPKPKAETWKDME